jgi:hypothetical protein
MPNFPPPTFPPTPRFPSSWSFPGSPTYGSGTPPDTTAPTISAISTSVTTTSVAVSFTTNEGAAARLRWGATTSYGNFTDWNNNTTITAHNESISGLVSGQTIHIQIEVKDAAGNPALSSDIVAMTALPADVTPPVISAVAHGTPTASGVTITWTTNEQATSRVQYRPVVGDGTWTLNTLDTTLVTSHSMTLAGLTSGTDYEFEVISADAADNSATSSPPSTFTTAAASGGLTQMTLTDVTSGVLSSTYVTATYNSIGIIVRFSGDNDGNATCTLEFKKSIDVSWRAGLPLWRWANGADRGFAGSVLDGVHIDWSHDLLAGTSYDIRLTITDGAETATVTATVTTRTDSIPAASSLTVTHYVDATLGNDTTGNGAIGTPWKTLQKVVQSAPSGAVVLVKAGRYKRATTTRTTPLMLVAEHPAVSEGIGIFGGRSMVHMVPANVGLESIIEPDEVVAPGTGWDQVTLTGPGIGGAPVGAQYTVWHRTSVVGSATQVSYSDTLSVSPTRLPGGVRSGKTAAEWAEIINTNLSYRSGFFATGLDVYVKLPGDVDPNTKYMGISSSGSAALQWTGSNVRISGFAIYGFDSGLRTPNAATAPIIDHNHIHGCTYSIRPDGAPPSTYGVDYTIQYNLITDDGIWTADETGVPWNTVKSSSWVRTANNSTSTWGKFYAFTENYGVYSGNGTGAKRMVIRYNTFDGTFNGISPHQSGSADKYASLDCDIHDNIFLHMVDDALEPETQQINMRVWANYIEKCFTVISLGPVNYGPIYLWRNIGWDIGPSGMAPDLQGFKQLGTPIIKYGGTVNPKSICYLINNSFWSNQPSMSGAQPAAGTGAVPEAFYLRNNIIRGSAYAFDVQVSASNGNDWNEDYNDFSTTDTGRGLRYSGVIYGTNVASYRTASGRGAATNNTGRNFRQVPDAELTNVATGDLTLALASALIGAGVIVANLSDLASQRTGSAPNKGAYA